MKQRPNGRLHSDPFLAWTELAWKTGEMMLAAAQVIGHRTGRIVAAGHLPSARDHREFTLMGQEKIEAAAEAAQAMAAHLLDTNLRLGLDTFNQLMAGATTMMSLADSRSFNESIAQQANLLQMFADSANAASQFALAAAHLAHHGLEPIHSRATANARRLGKRAR